MRSLFGIVLAAMMSAAATLSMAGAQEQGGAEPPAQEVEPLPEEYSCMFCHGPEGTLVESDDTKHLVVTEEDLTGDIHWQKGLRCHDCHGGSPLLEEYTDHRDDPDFLDRLIHSPADVATLCGRCHSDLIYMRHFDPLARTDQEVEYRTSGHGQRLHRAREEYEQALKQHKQKGGKGEPPVFPDPNVATCISCHGRHGILAVDNQDSPVYPTRVAETCAACHADAELMAGRTYGDPPRPIGHDQYDRWRQSVHGRAMLEKGDPSAATCNDCHGNHGALPPAVDSVAYACGTCHGKVAKLFAETLMKHRFEEEDVNLPGCATCHANPEMLDARGNPSVHAIQSPTDALLGMTGDGVCARCHGEEEGKYGRAGAEVAEEMRRLLKDLTREIDEAGAKIAEAERLGMEVQGPRFDLRQAGDALTSARSLMHSFAIEPVKEALDEGLEITATVKRRAEEALADHTLRRVWLAAALVPIGAVIVLLLLFIRTLPLPTK